MTLNTYHIKQNDQQEFDIRSENLFDVLKFYVLFTGIEKLSFYTYDYELNNFKYSFSVDGQKQFKEDIEDSSFSERKYSLIMEDDTATYGMITFDKDPQKSMIVKELLEKIKETLKKIFLLKKRYLAKESMLDIFIIADKQSSAFASKLSGNLNALLNANINIENSITNCLDDLKEKTKKSILIYAISDGELLKKEEEILDKLNEFLIVIGPSDYNVSLFCGKLSVYKYLSIDTFIPEQLKTIIVQLQNKIQNKYINNNQIISIAGISGGVGTTTIAMNTANLLAKKNPDRNVLYIDLSTTKAISNLFLEQNPLPKKTIIDLVNSDEFDIEKNLENGLVKVRENFYAINGIQKHIDSDFLSQDIFIEKLLEYISKISEKFNFIILDTGEAGASTLNSTIYDISNELWILTEMSLPHISKLKTFFSLMKRAGLKDKLSFLVNRYDSVNAISVSDVTSILNTANEDHLHFDFKIPNDYEVLGHCWNYCELVTNTNPKSIFAQKLEYILESSDFISKEQEKYKANKSLFGFLKGK